MGGFAERSGPILAVVLDSNEARALDALDHDLNISIGQSDVVSYSRDCSYGIDLVDAGLIDGCVVLSSQKYSLIAFKRRFEGAHAGRPSDYKGDHRVWENDYVPDGHHRTSHDIVRRVVSELIHRYRPRSRTSLQIPNFTPDPELHSRSRTSLQIPNFTPDPELHSRSRTSLQIPNFTRIAYQAAERWRRSLHPKSD